jgi:hypothetical protein
MHPHRSQCRIVEELDRGLADGASDDIDGESAPAPGRGIEGRRRVAARRSSLQHEGTVLAGGRLGHQIPRRVDEADFRSHDSRPPEAHAPLDVTEGRHVEVDDGGSLLSGEARERLRLAQVDEGGRLREQGVPVPVGRGDRESDEGDRLAGVERDHVVGLEGPGVLALAVVERGPELRARRGQPRAHHQRKQAAAVVHDARTDRRRPKLR